nr:hypothetical protein StreXyl84_67050 [Streptomyces sp. Xyl84]
MISATPVSLAGRLVVAARQGRALARWGAARFGRRGPRTGPRGTVRADTGGGCSIRLAAPEGPATIESDAATRVLLLWGRRPADPSRWHSSAGPQALRKVRALLSGY